MQASAYEACNHIQTPLHTPKTKTSKRACLVWLKNLQGVRQVAHLKQRFLSSTCDKIQRFYGMRKWCVFAISLVQWWKKKEEKRKEYKHKQF